MYWSTEDDYTSCGTTIQQQWLEQTLWNYKFTQVLYKS